MTLLVFGKTGQVATELARRVPDARFLSHGEADLADPEACARIVREIRPQAVINAAAYTAVDKAESEEALARIVNADAPGAIARACAAELIPFVHISTDYVFDGRGSSPFRPEDTTAPINAYGRTKRQGEEQVIAAGGSFAILRTSWVFSAHGANFLKTMLRLGRERDSLNVVADQIGGPTPAGAIADACLTLARALRADPGAGGIFHFSGTPDVSWAGFAREIMRQAGLPCRIEEIPTSAWPTPAVRPLNSRLDCSGLSRVGLSRPDWKAAIAEILTELEQKP